LSAPEAKPPALLPADASQSETGAWDASACARPDAVAAGLTARPGAAAEKSAVLVPDVPAQDAPFRLPERLQRWRAEPVSRAPYIPDAVRSGARSFSAAAPGLVRAQPVLPAAQPWSGRLAETQRAAEASLPELLASHSRLVQRVQPLPVAPREPTKQPVVPEAQTAVESVAAEL
jgi:hypothetical protein